MATEKTDTNGMSHVENTVDSPRTVVKQAAVKNIALADALTKDHQSFTSRSALRVYALAVVVTLSEFSRIVELPHPLNLRSMVAERV